MINPNPEMLERIARLANFYRNNPQESFHPSPALARFMKSSARRILVRAGNRVGKSVHAAVKLAKIMLSSPNKKYRAVGVNYKQSINVISKLLAQFIPKEQLADGCIYTETLGWSHNLIRLRNGTTCQIRSSDQAPIAHAGDDLDGVWIDEPPKHPIFLENLKRVFSKMGFLWVTATPIGRPCGYLRAQVEHENSVWEEHVASLSYENCPWYTEDQIKKWLTEAEADPGTYRQTVHGDWEGTSADRVFTGFDNASLITDDDESPKKCKFGIGIDHGESAGKQVAILVAWNSDGIWILDETVSTSATTPEQDARDIYKMILRNNIDLHHIDRIIGDVNSAGKLAGGRKINEILAIRLCSEAGYKQSSLRIEAPYKDPGSVDFGHKLLNAGFLRNQVHVHPCCKTLIHSLQHFNGANEDLKHAVDAARYILYPVLEKMNVSRSNPRSYQLT